MSLLRNRSFAVELAVMAGALGVVAALAWACLLYTSAASTACSS